MPAKKKSGGKRAGEKRRAAKAALHRRPDDYSQRWLNTYESLKDSPRDLNQAHEWTARLLLTALAEAATDPGMTPEGRREQIGRLAAQAAKVIDPGKVSARLSALEDELREMQKRMEQEHAGNQSAGAHGRGRAHFALGKSLDRRTPPDHDA